MKTILAKINAWVLLPSFIIIILLSFINIQFIEELDNSVDVKDYNKLLEKNHELVKDYNHVNNEYDKLLKKHNTLVNNYNKELINYNELTNEHDKLVDQYNELFDLTKEFNDASYQVQNVYDKLLKKHNTLVNDYNTLIKSINENSNNPELFDILIKLLPLLI